MSTEAKDSGYRREVTRKKGALSCPSVPCITALVFCAICWGVLADADGRGEGLGGDSVPAKLAARQIFEASGVALLSWIPVETLPGGSTSANDIWGYASPSGREYALVGLELGTAFLEITDPTAPVIVGYIAHTRTCCSDIKVYQQYAYVVNEGNSQDDSFGLRIINLTDIDNGVVTPAGSFAPSVLTQVHNLAINEESGFAYLCGSFGNVSDGGLFVVDLSDPANPSFAGAWSDTFVHDVQVVTYTEGPFAGREIAFAYTGFDLQLRIIDVTDKSAMVEIGSTTYPGAGFSHQGWLSEDRKYVYLNDEFDESQLGIPTTTYVIDVEDLTQPIFVTSFSNGLTSTDHNLMVRGNFVFEANYTSGLRIYDLTNLSSIEEVGYFDTYPDDDQLGFDGAWGVYADLPSGNLLVSDVGSGLFILDPLSALCSGPETVFEVGDRLELTIPDPVDIGQPIQWKKNGANLSDDGRISGSNSRTLIIEPLEYADSGAYTASYDDGTSRAFAIFCAITIRVGALPASGILSLTVLAVALITCGVVVLAPSLTGFRSETRMKSRRDERM